MRHRDARRTAALITCLAVVTSGVAILVHSGGTESRREASIADAVPGAAATGGWVHVGTATPDAVSATSPPPAVHGLGSGTTGGRTAPSTFPATFPLLNGALIGNSSPLKDVLQDQGMSVALPDGRSIWIFADTTQTSTAPYFFVTSSAAVSKRGSQQLTYAATTKHLPVEFLPRTKAERASSVTGNYIAVWPTGATMLSDGRILISYAKYHVTTSPSSYTLLGAGLYAFSYRGLSHFREGAQATRVADNLWSAAEGAIGSPVYASGYVYFTTCENLECYAVRSPSGSITSHSSYRWWNGKGWSSARSARAPMAYGSSRPGVSPSMAYLPGYRVYATTGTAAGHVSGTGLLWVAPHPWGPWSAPASFALPHCPASGCYTLNLHPNESIGGRIRISYATSGIGPYVRVTDLTARQVSTTAVRIR